MTLARKFWLSAVKSLPFLMPVLLLCAIWVPEFSHYYVPGMRITSDVVHRARAAPSNEVLREIEGMRLFSPTFSSSQELVDSAERLLQGELRLPNFPVYKPSVPFSPKDLLSAPAPLQFASLVIPQILLDAYDLTKRDEFFLAATDAITSFAEYEATAWLDHGFLWNDHAVAARIAVLTKFWRLYRARPDFDRRVAGQVLQLLARSGQMLAKPSHYTFKTNHGVMQNVALLQLCVAYAQLAADTSWCSIAVDRLKRQLEFYVSPEGVILEHSAGYHSFGLELMGMMMRCLELLDQPVPAEWVGKYSKARDVFAQLRRPDGTLPAIGDTPSSRHEPLVTLPQEGGIPALGTATWRPARSFALYPVSGQAVWWTGLDGWPRHAGLSQTAVTWSFFRGHGHKLADELSVVLWAGGETWVTNSGYWPYGRWGRAQAESWTGSNAPHLVAEGKDSQRSSTLVGYADHSEVRLLDLHRQHDEGYQVRRQILQVRSTFWLIVDHVQDRVSRTSRTMWTLGPGFHIQQTADHPAFLVRSRESGAEMAAFFVTSAQTDIRTIKGNRDPFGGWVVSEQGPVATTAFVVEQPSRDSWALAVWHAGALGKDLPAGPRVVGWNGAENWKIEVPLSRADGAILLERTGDALSFEDQRSRSATRIAITPGPDVSSELRHVGSAFQSEEADSVRYRELYGYRLKVTIGILALLLFQALTLLVVGRRLRSYHAGVRSTAIGCWAILGTWILFIYLKT